jgi:hypothetical protein
MSLVVDGEVFFTEVSARSDRSCDDFSFALPCVQEDIAKTGAVLANESTPLAERFRAVFVLRNIGGEASIDALMGGSRNVPAKLRFFLISVKHG